MEISLPVENMKSFLRRFYIHKLVYLIRVLPSTVRSIAASVRYYKIYLNRKPLFLNEEPEPIPFNKRNMYCYPQTDWKSASYVTDHTKNNIESKIFATAIESADIGIDCGANLAEFLLRVDFTKTKKSLDMVLFEANPKLCRAIEKTISELPIQKNCHLEKMGVSDKSYNGEFFVNLFSSGASSELADQQKLTNDTWGYNQSIIVKSSFVSLDQYAQTKGLTKKKSWVIKIDVEGSELKVLHGAKQVLSNAEKMCLIVEFSPESLKNTSDSHLDTLIELFKSCVVYKIVGSDLVVLPDFSTYKSQAECTANNMDLLFIRNFDEVELESFLQ